MKKIIFLMMIFGIANMMLGCALGRSTGQPSTSEMTDQMETGETSEKEMQEVSIACKDDSEEAGMFAANFGSLEGTMTKTESFTGTQRQGSFGMGGPGLGGMKAGCGAETEEFMKTREDSPENEADTITDEE